MFEQNEAYAQIKKDILARRTVCRDELSKVRKAYKQCLDLHKQLADASSSEDRARLAEVTEQLNRLLRKLKEWHALQQKLNVPVTRIMPVQVRRINRPSEVLYFNGVLINSYKKKLRGCQFSTVIDESGHFVINYQSPYGVGALTLAPFELYGSIFIDYEDRIPEMVLSE